MKEFYLTCKSSSLHCIRFGKGEKLLICFHGFGEDAKKFLALESSLSKCYSVIAVDLPFHGKTKWKQGELFLKEDLKTLIEDLMESENKNRFSLMGFSLGGKIVLAAIESFSTQIDEVILVAPDGIKARMWYNIAVYPKWGQKLFQRFVRKPQFVFSIARVLRTLRILNDRFYKFLQIQTESEVKRQLVFDVWTTIKDFETKLNKVKQQLNQHHIKSYIFIGRYDQVITTVMGKLFSEGLNDCRFIILEKGHNLINESLNQPLNEALKA